MVSFDKTKPAFNLLFTSVTWIYNVAIYNSGLVKRFWLDFSNWTVWSDNYREGVWILFFIIGPLSNCGYGKRSLQQLKSFEGSFFVDSTGAKNRLNMKSCSCVKMGVSEINAATAPPTTAAAAYKAFHKPYLHHSFHPWAPRLPFSGGGRGFLSSNPTPCCAEHDASLQGAIRSELANINSSYSLRSHIERLNMGGLKYYQSRGERKCSTLLIKNKTDGNWVFHLCAWC